MYKLLLTKVLHFSLKRPFKILCLTLFSLIGSIICLSHLELKGNFSDLLPEHSESVQMLKTLQDEFGSFHYLVILVKHQDRNTAITFAEKLAQEIGKLDDVLFVEYKKPAELAHKRPLAFVSLEDLNEIDRRLKKYLQMEREGNAPQWSIVFNLTDDAPLDFSDIRKRYSLEKDSPLSRMSTGEYYENEAQNSIALLVRPKHDGLNPEESKKFVDRIQKIERTISSQHPYRHLHIFYSGELKKLVDQQHYLKKEIVSVLSLVFFAVALIILLYYRSFLSILLIAIPTAVGIAWSGAITALLWGHLNIITSFSGAILLGLGSDYGIYFLNRYFQEKSKTQNIHSALTQTMCFTGKATAVASLTTAIAFMGLSFSRFQGFKEFGVVGAIGIIASYIAMVLLLPPCILLCEKKKFFEKERKLLRWIPTIKTPHFKLAGSKMFFGSTLFASLCFLLIGGSEPFEIKYDIEKMERYHYEIESIRHSKEIDEIFNNQLRPLLYIANSADHEKDIISALHETSTMNPGLIQHVIALSTLLPDHSSAKMGKIDEIYRHWKKISSPIVRKRYEDFMHPSTPSLHSNDTPSLNRFFLSPDSSSERRLVYVTSALSRTTAKNIEKFGSALSSLHLKNGEQVHASGSWMVFYEIVSLIKKEALRIFSFALLFILFALFIAFGSTRDAILVFSGLATSFIVMGALLVIFKIELNMLNIAILPLLLGVGVDSFIHYYHCYREDALEQTEGSWKKVAPSIAIANLTTIIGLGSFVLSANEGLRTIGSLAIIGVVSITLVSLVWFPLLLQTAPSFRSGPIKKIWSLIFRFQFK